MAAQEWTVHIGLPKTATTTLQTHVFPQLPEYVGKFVRDDLSPDENWTAYRQLSWQGPVRAWSMRDPQWRDSVQVWASELARSGRTRVLLSDELLALWPASGNLSLWPLQDEWPTIVRTRPHPILEYLKTVQAAAGEDVKLRAILTLRNQADLMGSMYAQIQGAIATPCQSDFESKVRYLLQTDDPYFDYADLVEGLHAALGPTNGLILLHENSIRRNVQEMSTFLGRNLDATAAERQPENVRHIGSTSWQGAARTLTFTNHGLLRSARVTIRGRWRKSDKGAIALMRAMAGRIDAAAAKYFSPHVRPGVEIVMTDELRREIKDHFARTNARVAHLLGRDLEPLGY